MNGMSFRASRRLDDLADRVVEEAEEYVGEGENATVEGVAHELATDDDLLRDAVEAETLLSRQANARRKETTDPFGDDVLDGLRDSRDVLHETVEERVEELVGETVESVEEIREERQEAEVEAEAEAGVEAGEAE